MDNILIMQVDDIELPIYQHTYDIYSSLKEYCWWNNQEYKVIKVTSIDELKSLTIPTDSNVVVSGSVEFCYSYYPRTLSIQPIFSNIPYEFIKRKIWFGTKKDIDNNIFVKPLVDVKLFTGYLVEDKSNFDFITDSKVKEDTPLFFSEPINIIDEYRVWVMNGHISDLRSYYMESDILPNKYVINACNQFIYGFHKKPFVADYAITGKGETVLIEVNDIHGTGTYGFNGTGLWNILKNKIK